MSRLGRGKGLKVRGKGKKSKRFPPRTRSTSRLQPPAALPTLDVSIHRLTHYERLGGTSENPAPSKFGGSTLERAADNAFAEIGQEFDDAQVVIQLPMTGSYTIVDRVKKPKTMVYLDGIQHDLRVDTAQQDFIQKLALQDLGYMVIRIKQKDMERDPISTIRQVLYPV